MPRLQQGVGSSNVLEIGYDPLTRTLEINFKGDRPYFYEDVDPGTFAALMAAPSKGSFVEFPTPTAREQSAPCTRPASVTIHHHCQIRLQLEDGFGSNLDENRVKV